ncbi:aliphatic sulfonate ABC transporter substrate-binding protein [Roseomonas populi]|uniref:Aliphatic sulfonate ABC transporter substrate-binding protein n=1 Tax=Roseomonas populi TaxID=3121582 RepID=A0ABT1X258_9PROT|nr:aliphatic sulfonate ABC transporter substrate-binding protein [Roseomonas pecuniae]MCR0982178.1 aliphatic sulfonate ABC transporter substrate-binding protein [Roseomonas pecuniae]
MLSRRTALLAALAAPAVARAQSPVIVRAAQYKAGDGLLLRLAGLADTPYRVEWSEFGSGNLMLEAANAGALDLAYGSEIPPTFAAVSGARVKLVAVIRGDVNEQTVLVPKDSAIQSIKDLKGKRVGYVRATTTHYYLSRMLNEVGLSLADVQLVNLTPADGAAAFRNGALDAWAIYGYSVPIARQSGARVLRTAQGILSGNYPYFTRANIGDEPARAEAVRDLLDRIRRALPYIQEHPAEYAAAQAAALNVPEATIRALLDNVSQPRSLAPVDDAAIASQQAVADEFARIGIIPRKVDVAPMWDRNFWRPGRAA